MSEQCSCFNAGMFSVQYIFAALPDPTPPVLVLLGPIANHPSSCISTGVRKFL